MDVFSDGNLVARFLTTLATVGYSVVTVLADFNKTHASNPKWTPHARFHVVWQISSYSGFALLALGLIWWPGGYAVERLYLACLFAAVVYGAFFVALAAMPIYGGRTYDDNGYLPFAAPLGLRQRWDVNITAFSAFTIVLIAAALLVSRSAAAG
jgi:hypothetical protein